jgi:hypothetical protein
LSKTNKAIEVWGIDDGNNRPWIWNLSLRYFKIVSTSP